MKSKWILFLTLKMGEYFYPFYPLPLGKYKVIIKNGVKKIYYQDGIKLNRCHSTNK
jgi:hypothetical protein